MAAQKTIRIAPDIDSKVTTLNDLNTGEAIFFHRGNDLRFDISPFRSKTLFIPSSGSVFLEVKLSSNAEDIPVVSTKTEVFNSISFEQWQSGSNVLSLSVSGAETTKVPAGLQRLVIWWSDGGQNVTFYSGLINVKESAVESIYGNGYTVDKFEKLSAKGIANGYTPLGSNGRIESRFLPESISIGGKFLGGLAAKALPKQTENPGDWYFITTEGTNHGIAWSIGDKAVYNGTPGDWTQVPVDLGDIQVSVNTKAELEALNPASYNHGQIVLMRGYHSISDGGGGLFWLDNSGQLDAGKANSGTNFKVTQIANPYWRRLYSHHIFPEMFGAYGDWDKADKTRVTLDDAQAFQDAMDYLSDQGRGVLHLYPEKTYLLRSTLKLHPGTSIEGNLAKIQFAPADEQNFLKLEGIFENISIRQLNVIGNAYAGNGIVAEKMSKCEFNQVSLKNFKSSGFKGNSLYSVNFNNCSFENCDVGIEIGNAADSAAYSTHVGIHNCSFEKNHRNCIKVGHCKDLLIDNAHLAQTNSKNTYQNTSCIDAIDTNLGIQGGFVQNNFADFIHANSNDSSHGIHFAHLVFEGTVGTTPYDLAVVDNLANLEIGPCVANSIEFSTLVRVKKNSPKLIRYKGFKDTIDWNNLATRKNSESIASGDKRKTTTSGKTQYWLAIEAGTTASQKPSMISDGNGYFKDGTLKWREIGRFIKVDPQSLVDYAGGANMSLPQLNLGDKWHLKQGGQNLSDEFTLNNDTFGQSIAIHPSSGFMAFNKSGEAYSKYYKHDFGGNIGIHNHNANEPIADFYDAEAKRQLRLNNNGFFEFGSDSNTQRMNIGKNARGAWVNGARVIEPKGQAKIDLKNDHPSGIPFSAFMIISVMRKWTEKEKFYDTALFLMSPDRISGRLHAVEHWRSNYEVKWDGSFLTIINHQAEKVGVNVGILAIANAL